MQNFTLISCYALKILFFLKARLVPSGGSKIRKKHMQFHVFFLNVDLKCQFLNLLLLQLNLNTEKAFCYTNH